MIVRARTDEDLPACVALLRAVHESDGYPSVWQPEPVTWLTPRSMRSAWVAEVDGTVCGHVAVVDGSAEPRVAEAAAVEVGSLVLVTRLFASPVHRGQGLGSALLDAAGAHARDAGRRLALDVATDSTAAIALYERLGWVAIGERVASWRTPTGEHARVRFYLAPPD